ESEEIIATLDTSAVAESAPAEKEAPAEEAAPAAEATDAEDAVAAPAARKLISEAGLDINDIKGTGKGGRITKEDVQAAIQEREARRQSAAPAAQEEATQAPLGAREERRVPMTRLRKRIAERLVAAQQEAAMLTTFNEVNMEPIMNMLKSYQAEFEKAHGVRLGFMRFFVRACVEALKRFTALYASIDGDVILYHGFYDVGVAVSTERGLVVPVLRDADQKGLAEVEADIIEYGTKAQEGRLSIDEMTGGTFTISNGGVFGSLLSTPILNPPQTAILGMHTIQQRPMAVNGEVKILPMMYLALSYDHRLIDGKEAVQFLVAVKNFLEDPARLLLDI